VTAAVQIRAMAAADWPRVRAIYGEGIATGNATFETTAPGWAAWDVAHLADHRLVACCGEHVVAWAALGRIYVGQEARGQGIGRALLEALVRGSELAGFWTIQTGIFPENTASVRLHEACRFRVVGRRERIGCLHGRWRDTLFLERRSQVV